MVSGIVEFVILISFDLSCAFDSLRPEFVSEKLARMGLRGRDDWLISFLTNRKYLVWLNNSRSEPHASDIGTSQGSVLGPLIFLLYVNDLPEHLSALFAYADDTTVIVSNVDRDGVYRRVSRVVDEFKSWCDKNRLVISQDKT